jgi:hypothetical protein
MSRWQRVTAKSISWSNFATAGSTSRFSNQIAQTDGQLPTTTLLDNLRSPTLHAWRPPGGVLPVHFPTLSFTPLTAPVRAELHQQSLKRQRTSCSTAWSQVATPTSGSTRPTADSNPTTQTGPGVLVTSFKAGAPIWLPRCPRTRPPGRLTGTALNLTRPVSPWNSPAAPPQCLQLKADFSSAAFPVSSENRTVVDGHYFKDNG